MSIIKQISASLLGIVLVGTGTRCARRAELPQYKMAFYNGTTGHIMEARADWMVDGHAGKAEGGAANPGVSKVEMLRPQPVPEIATVKWRTANGISHKREVEIKKLIAAPDRFDGTIFLKIAESGTVTVVPLTDNQMLNLSMRHQDYP